MDKKLPLLVASSRSKRPDWPTLTCWKMTLIGALGFLGLLHLYLLLGSSHLSPPSCDLHSLHKQTITYPGEHISWSPCGELINRTMECSSIDVPMDQFNATNSGNKTFSMPLIRLRGHNATQSLFVNPGGPGGSGMQFIPIFGEKLHTVVGEGFHLLSFDPRGVNGSRPLADCFPAGKEGAAIRQDHQVIHDGKKIDDSGEIYAWASNYVKACVETMGEHGKYINTPQTAADMNSILNAIGQEDMIYWGFSYGTLLGQTYASLFPERSARVIIDGVVNLFDWYESMLDLESLEDSEKVFDGFLGECVNAGPNNCPLASAAKDEHELKAKFLAFVTKIDDQPLSVYINNTHYGILTAEKVLYAAIFPVLYRPADWPPLADRLAKLLDGNATDFFLAYGMAPPWELVGESIRFVTLNDGMTGPAHWPEGRDALLQLVRPSLNDSMFSEGGARINYLKQQWPLPSTHNFAPKRPELENASGGVKTAHPLLIINTSFDPVCPLVSARTANAAFKDSKLVEIKGYGHCSIAAPSRCVAQKVRAFLYNGTLPDGYTTCEVDEPYFPATVGGDGTRDLAAMEFENEHERSVYEAQVWLARKWIWRQ